MYHSFLIHSSADGHLGCFHVLAIIHSAVMNIGVHVSLSDLVSSVCMPRSGIAGDTGLIPGTGRSPGEGIGYPLQYSWASLETQLIENPPAMWESWVRSLDWEDSLEESMATHASILVWRTPWTEDPGVLQSVGLQS